MASLFKTAGKFLTSIDNTLDLANNEVHNMIVSRNNARDFANAAREADRIVEHRQTKALINSFDQEERELFDKLMSRY